MSYSNLIIAIAGFSSISFVHVFSKLFSPIIKLSCY